MQLSSLKLTLQEQESLMRLKTMEYLATSTITLTSLAQLLGKISNMVINDHIQEQVEQALEAIHQVRKQFVTTSSALHVVYCVVKQ